MNTYTSRDTLVNSLEASVVHAVAYHGYSIKIEFEYCETPFTKNATYFVDDVENDSAAVDTIVSLCWESLRSKNNIHKAKVNVTEFEVYRINSKDSITGAVTTIGERRIIIRTHSGNIHD